MGLFDSVYVDCPHCGSPVEFQSKALDGSMTRFTLEDAPHEILMDIMNEPQHCRRCDNWMALTDPAYPPGKKPRPNLRPSRIRTPECPRTHFQGFKWWPEDQPFTQADIEPERGATD